MLILSSVGETLGIYQNLRHKMPPERNQIAKKIARNLKDLKIIELSL